MLLRRVLVASLLALAACAGPDTDSSGWVEGADSPGKADSWDDIVVTTDEMTVTISREIVRDNDTFILSADTDKKIVSGLPYVRSRANPAAREAGSFAKTGDHSFEVSMSTRDLMRLAGGETLYVDLTIEGDTKHHIVMIELQARVSRYDGYLNAQQVAVPHWIDGGIAYRFAGQGEAGGDLTGSSMWIASEQLDGVAEPGARGYYDIPEATMAIALGADEKFEMIEVGGEGYFVPLVKRASMTSSAQSATELFVGEGCYQRTCLAGLAAGTRDTSACGEAVEIMACRGELGITVDAALRTQALAANPVDQTQASAFVGADRAGALVTGATAARAERLSHLDGTWFVDKKAAKAAMADSLARQWGETLADPFAYVTQRPTRISATATPGEVAADALLRYLPTEDLVHSEFSSALPRVTRQSAAEHVEVFRRMRAGLPLTADDEAVNTAGDVVTFTGDWMGAYIEVTVSRDEDPSVNFEID